MNQIGLGNVKIEHERSIYTFMDMIGDLGGVQEILIMMFGLLLFPFSEYSFVLKFMSKMYLVKTSKLNIFQTVVGKPKKKNSNKLKYKTLKYQMPESIETPSNIAMTNMHYPAKISSSQKLKLCLS